MVIPKGTRFDSYQLEDVRKVISRALTWDPRNVGGTGMPGSGVFTSVYLPSAQVSVSSMDVGLLSRSPLWTYISRSRAFLAGDHWQGGMGWAGPWPRPTSDGSSQLAIADIEKRFVSQNVLAELLDRHVTGAIGREPHWTMSPRRPVDEEHPITTEEQSLIDEANAALTEWWDLRRVHELMQQACATMLFARRGMFRLYIPQGQLEDVLGEDGETRKLLIIKDFVQALMTIWLDHPAPERSTVAQEDDTKEHIGALLYSGGISVTGDGTPVEVGELTYLDPATGVTVLRALDRSYDVEWSADLGGRLLMHEMNRPLFLTPQLQQMQEALNLSLSMLPRHLVTAGFLERVLLNAQMPGHWEKDPISGDVRGKWVPDAAMVGPGVQTFYTGVEEEQTDGTIKRATPQVHDRLPVSPEPSISAIRAMYEMMLEEANQSHVLMNKAAGASGKSREQARSDYERSLTTTAPRLERAGRWLLETLLATAEALSGQPGKYTKTLRAVFTLRLDTGPVDSLERAANDLSYKNGTLSREGAMARNGVADVDAETELIDAQPGAELALTERMTIVFNSLVGEGVAPEQAARIAGFSEDDINLLIAGFEPPPEIDPLTGL
jgi:hypothetical protein